MRTVNLPCRAIGTHSRVIQTVDLDGLDSITMTPEPRPRVRLWHGPPGSQDVDNADFDGSLAELLRQVYDDAHTAGKVAGYEAAYDDARRRMVLSEPMAVPEYPEPSPPLPDPTPPPVLLPTRADWLLAVPLVRVTRLEVVGMDRRVESEQVALVNLDDLQSARELDTPGYAASLFLRFRNGQTMTISGTLDDLLRAPAAPGTQAAPGVTQAPQGGN